MALSDQYRCKEATRDRLLALSLDGMPDENIVIQKTPHLHPKDSLPRTIIAPWGREKNRPSQWDESAVRHWLSGSGVVRPSGQPKPNRKR